MKKESFATSSLPCFSAEYLYIYICCVVFCLIYMYALFCHFKRLWCLNLYDYILKSFNFAKLSGNLDSLYDPNEILHVK